MSEETGLYDKLTIGGEPFRRWHSTGTLEVFQDGKWTSIPIVAQRAIDAITLAIVAEREACAKIAEEVARGLIISTDHDRGLSQASTFIADAIRARGQTTSD